MMTVGELERALLPLKEWLDYLLFKPDAAVLAEVLPRSEEGYHVVQFLPEEELVGLRSHFRVVCLDGTQTEHASEVLLSKSISNEIDRNEVNTKTIYVPQEPEA